MRKLHFVPNNGYTEIATFNNEMEAWDLVESVEEITDFEFNYHNLISTEDNESGNPIYLYADNGGNVNVLIENKDIDLFKKLIKEYMEPVKMEDNVLMIY